MSSNNNRADQKYVKENTERVKFTDKENDVANFRRSYLDVPIKKIWESDWTLLIPETHK